MELKEIFKPELKKVIVTAVIFIVIAFFFLPIKENVLCKPGSPCPPVNAFIKFPEMSVNPRFLEINYFFVGIELVVAYVISSLGMSFLNSENKKSLRKK